MNSVPHVSVAEPIGAFIGALADRGSVREGTQMKSTIAALALALFGAVGTLCGCRTYPINAEARPVEKRDYEVVDKAVKRAYSLWTGPVKQSLGANEQGLIIIQRGGATTTRLAGGGSWTKVVGSAKLIRWEEIAGVKVQAVFVGIGLIGMADPTVISHVQVKLVSGDSFTLVEDPNNAMYGDQLFPFWLFKTEWQWAHECAKAIQLIADSKKTAHPSRQPAQ